MEEGDNPGLKAPPSLEGGHWALTQVVGALAGWWKVGALEPSNTYPLVLHGLLGLLQYPLHFFYGHHLIRAEGVSSVRHQQKPLQ